MATAVMAPLSEPRDRGEHPQSLLIVEDHQVLRDRLARAFRDRGFDVRVASNFDEAVTAANEDSPELAVVDMRMPGRSGLELLRALKQIDQTTKVVIMTGFGSIATAVEAMRLGATSYVQKPADADDILTAFMRAELPPQQAVPADSPPPTLARVEWEHIHRVLSDCGNNVSEAARRLGIHRRSLQRKLQKQAPD
jgi:two-component system response regulator RegA